MKITGLITEYNPFHNGHQYHIKKARELTGADYIVAVMSGNFMQRGEPAIIDKHTRTKMALSCGADLVLELPACYACGSAEYFAFGAVNLLHQLRIVNSLCFGSETGEASSLKSIANILYSEPPSFQFELKEGLKAGMSFPSARQRALETYLGKGHMISPVLNSPNNILGIEYMKALMHFRSPITPLTIKRAVNGYHQPSLSDTDTADKGISSATSIRRELVAGNLKPLQLHMPEQAFNHLKENLQNIGPVISEDYSLLLHYCLLHASSEDLMKIQDISPDLAERICNLMAGYRDIDSFVHSVKTKQFTETRIRRALLHLILSVKKQELAEYIDRGWNQYIRILGFRKDASSLLGEINRNSPLPIISKLADAHTHLSASALHMLQKDIRRSEIYGSVKTNKYHTEPYNEYANPIIIL